MSTINSQTINPLVQSTTCGIEKARHFSLYWRLSTGHKNPEDETFFLTFSMWARHVSQRNPWVIAFANQLSRFEGKSTWYLRAYRRSEKLSWFHLYVAAKLSFHRVGWLQNELKNGTSLNAGQYYAQIQVLFISCYTVCLKSSWNDKSDRRLCAKDVCGDERKLNFRIKGRWKTLPNTLVRTQNTLLIT